MLRIVVYSRPVLIFLAMLLFAAPLPASGEEASPASNRNTEAPARELHHVKLVFEPDAYYTDLDLILSLTKGPPFTWIKNGPSKTDSWLFLGSRFCVGICEKIYGGDRSRQGE